MKKVQSLQLYAWLGIIFDKSIDIYLHPYLQHLSNLKYKAYNCMLYSESYLTKALVYTSTRNYNI